MTTNHDHDNDGDKGLSRRHMLQTAAFVGGAGVLTGLVAGPRRAAAASTFDVKADAYPLCKPENVLYSSCLQCHVSCQIKAKLWDGELVKLDGNPYSPQNHWPQLSYDTPVDQAVFVDAKLCSKGQAGVQTRDDPYRIRRVLKRAGPRGSNRWTVIPFDQAVSEITQGGDLFGEGKVEGLADILVLRDAALFKALAADVIAIRKGSMTVAEFKERHADHLDVLIDPDHPDLGPKNNQLVFAAGRCEHGREEYVSRFMKHSFGSVNFFDHYNICEPGHHLAWGTASMQYLGNGKWGHGKSHFKVDLASTEFVLYIGTGAFEANFGSTPMSEKLTTRLVNRQCRLAVADPRCSKTAAHADWWLPVKPGTDAALLFAIMQWIFEYDQQNTAYLANANRAAADAAGEPTWTSASYLVKLDASGRGERFLRSADLGLEGDPDRFVVISGGLPVAVDPNDREDPVQADVFSEQSLEDGSVAKSSLALLRERVREHSIDEWADRCGVDARTIREVAQEFTSHGRQAAADMYRGACQHANGYMTSLAVVELNQLIGNASYKGGVSTGGGHWHAKGGKPGSVYDIEKLHPGALSPFGISSTRAGIAYEHTTLFQTDGYPSRRPWWPHIKSMYSEVVASAEIGYPYPVKALFHSMGTLALSVPGGNDKRIAALKDPKVIPLFVSFDIVVGETSMFADYIIPDIVYLERWGAPHTTPDIQTVCSKVRQPVARPLTEVVDVDGQQMPICLESFLLAAGKKLGTSGVGKDGFAPGMSFDRMEDYYLKFIANIAFGDKVDDAVPPASKADLALFAQARTHLPSSMYDLDRWKATVKPEHWARMVTVLNRGGRFEDYRRYVDSGSLVPHPFKGMLNFFIEDIATTRSSYDGSWYDGLPAYEVPMDQARQPIEDAGYPLKLITYKEIFGGHSRTISNYWANYSLQPGNRLWIHPQTAKSYGIADGDSVRLRSKGLPTGVMHIDDAHAVHMVLPAMVTEGIRPGVVAVSWHYGHWNGYGGGDGIVVDGVTVRADPRRKVGIAPNPLFRQDETSEGAGAPVCCPLSGSASYFDTSVEIEKVLA